jgi:hypothetical protein
MSFKKTSLLLLLPLAISACDSGQPTYSASNTTSAPPPPAQAQPAPQSAPPPVAQAPAAPVPPPTAPARPAPAVAPGFDSASRFTQAPPGKMGPVAKLGVGSCDDYIERYRTCFNSTTIPREQKFPLRRTLGEQMRQWKADAQAGKISQVAAACSDADKKARVEFAKVGCTTF